MFSNCGSGRPFLSFTHAVTPSCLRNVERQFLEQAACLRGERAANDDPRERRQSGEEGRTDPVELAFIDDQEALGRTAQGGLLDGHLMEVGAARPALRVHPASRYERLVDAQALEIGQALVGEE